MTNLQRFIFCILVLSLSISCTSPKKALEKENYLIAMSLASKKISKQANLEENTDLIQKAANALANKTIQNYQNIKSEDVRDWKRSQNKIYNVLNSIQNHNAKTDGLLTNSYDMLCEVKHEVDLKIIDFYYDEGITLLNKSKSLNESQWARMAYNEFINSEKEGAKEFYSNVDQLKEECILHGAVIVDAPSNVALNNIFLKPKHAAEDAEVDCVVQVHQGFINSSDTSTSSQETQTKEIVVGQNAVTDTSGITTYQNIMQEIVGYKNITKITYNATQTLNINIVANTSECFLSNRGFNLTETETCEEISYTGDTRVFVGTFDKSCSSFFIQNEMKRKLGVQLNQNLVLY